MSLLPSRNPNVKNKQWKRKVDKTKTYFPDRVA